MIKYFPDSGLQMKAIIFYSHNNSGQVFAIFLLHHRHHHATTGTSTFFLNNPYLFADNRHIFLGQEIYLSPLYQD